MLVGRPGPHDPRLRHVGILARLRIVLWQLAHVEDHYVRRLLVPRIPRGRLVIYPETGHAVHWERPETFVEDLRDFMNARAR